MAQFIGYLQGGRGLVSRTGTKNSGLSARAQGWNIGGECAIVHNSQTGKDEVTFWLTSGSNGGKIAKIIGVFDADCLK